MMSQVPTNLHLALTIEAMRLGVVPVDDLEKFTVGRDIELDVIRRDLEQCRLGGARRAFLGDYGLGKSHLLELLRQVALRNNFIVSQVTLDHSEISPSQPKRVYHAAVSSLTYPNSLGLQPEGLAPLLELAARDENVAKKYMVGSPMLRLPIRQQLEAGLHLYLSPAIAYMKALLDTDALKIPDSLGPKEQWGVRARHMLLDWIEGHPTGSNQDINDELNKIAGRFPKIYSLLDYRPWAKIYGYIINGISQLARDVGYSGLVIIIDEAEFYSLLSSQDRVFARSLFQAWSHAVSADGGDLLPQSQDGLLIGGYGIQRELPVRYSDAPGVYLVFAMTPNSEGMGVLKDAVPLQNICHINQLSLPDYLKMIGNVLGLYNEAYPDASIPAGLVQPLSGLISALSQQGLLSNPRQIMKFLIELFDTIRYNIESVSIILNDVAKEFQQ